MTKLRSWTRKILLFHKCSNYIQIYIYIYLILGAEITRARKRFQHPVLTTKTRSYDTECSNYNPYLSTHQLHEADCKVIKVTFIYIYIYIYIIYIYIYMHIYILKL